MENPKITECCLCNSPLVVDIAYVDDEGMQWASREGVSLYELPIPFNGHEDKHPIISALYCPIHRIVFKA